MAHHMRNLAADTSDPNTSMDPTLKKLQPKASHFTTTTTSTTKPHPTPPDPTTAPSTVQNISNRFSKLYSNHKALASTKASGGLPHIDTHQQAKALAVSTISDSSASSLFKTSRKYSRNVRDFERDCRRSTIAKDQCSKSLKKSCEEHDIKREIISYKADEIKKSSKKERAMKESREGHDIKKAIVMRPTHHESEVLKGFDEGCEMKRPSVSLAMRGGRRRSFCSSQTELADFLSCNGVKVVSVDMPPFMQIHAVDCARKTYDSLEKFTARTLASTLKKEFDGVYGPAWHCIVGTSFGSFVTHSVGGFLYFSMDHKLYILLFKTTVQKAD